MSWFKVDDKFAFHPKVIAAGNAAVGLWVRAGTWSADQLTDGHIPESMITVLGGKVTEAKRLVDLGLWDRSPGGYQFHDWEEYQPSKEEAEARSERRSQSGTLGNHRRWHKDKPSKDCPYCLRSAS